MMRRHALGRIVSSLLLLASACALGACPDGRPEALPGPVDLPVVSILGAEPPRAGRVDITITATRRVYVGAKPTTLKGLRPLLIEASGGKDPAGPSAGELAGTVRGMAARDGALRDGAARDALPPREPGPRQATALASDGARAADVLLRIDRETPSLVVARILMECVHPSVQLTRMFVSVLDGRDRRPGAIAVFLPKDRCCATGPLDGELVRLSIGPERPRAAPHPSGPGIADGMQLIHALRRRRATPETPIGVSIKLRAGVPWGRVVSVVEAAVRAGAYSLVFEGAHEGLEHVQPGGPIEEFFARYGGELEPGPHVVSIHTPALVDQPLGDALPAGRRAGYVGFANDPSLEQLIGEEEEVVEEPLEDD
ncbi:MAG: hypothetical protein P1V36_14325 [Planctomycetota bacterium]|nr:hypothetical protein [Planctomycetota bacterium]